MYDTMVGHISSFFMSLITEITAYLIVFVDFLFMTFFISFSDSTVFYSFPQCAHGSITEAYFHAVVLVLAVATFFSKPVCP